MKNCPVCNNELTRLENQTEIVKHKTSKGIKEILLDGLSFSECHSCGEVFYSASDIELHEKKLDEVLEN